MSFINCQKEDDLRSASVQMTKPTRNCTEELTDENLWLKFKGGDEMAYANIYRKHAPLLYSYGLKLVNDRDLVKDCIQDLFVEIWGSKENLGDVKEIKPYLFRSLRRKVIHEAVKNRKKTVTDKFDNYLKQLHTESKECTLIEDQTSDLRIRKLKQGLDHLTKRQREVVHLKFYSKFSYEEISDILSISVKGTYKLMGRSITILRKHLDQ